MDEMGCWSLFPSLLGRHRPGASGRRQGTFTKESLPSKPIMQYHSCQIITVLVEEGEGLLELGNLLVGKLGDGHLGRL
jgi:hypothetical protein